MDRLGWLAGWLSGRGPGRRQSTIEDKPDMPPTWPPGRTLTEQARWVIKNYPGNDPTIVGSVDPPYMLSADLFYKICSIEE